MPAVKGKRGFQKVDNDLRKEHRVVVRLNKLEVERLDKYLKHIGKTRTEFLMEHIENHIYTIYSL